MNENVNYLLYKLEGYLRIYKRWIYASQNKHGDIKIPENSHIAGEFIVVNSLWASRVPYGSPAINFLNKDK